MSGVSMASSAFVLPSYFSGSATFRVPRQSGDGYRSALPLATEGTQECRGRFVGEVLDKC